MDLSQKRDVLGLVYCPPCRTVLDVSKWTNAAVLDVSKWTNAAVREVAKWTNATVREVVSKTGAQNYRSCQGDVHLLMFRS